MELTVTATKKLGLITRLGATAVIATGLALATQSSAMAAPTVSVSPASDGQTVAVSASGLTPNTVFHIGQCAQVEAQKFGCNKSTSTDVTTNAQGEINTSLVVHSSFEAVVSADGPVWGTVDAKTTQTQVVVLSDTGEGGGQAITFK